MGNISQQLKKMFVSIPFRVMISLLCFMCFAIGTMAYLSFAQVDELSKENADKTVNRASLTAAALVESKFYDQFQVVKNNEGLLIALKLKPKVSESFLAPSPLINRFLQDLGATNQGAASIFSYNAIKNDLSRFDSTHAKNQGAMAINYDHPSFNDLVQGKRFVGKVPFENRFRFETTVPIQDAKGGTIGALSYDVGFTDDLSRLRDDLKRALLWAAILILSAMTVIGSYLLYVILKPLKTIGMVANLLAKGQMNTQIPFMKRTDEIGDIAKSISMVGEMQKSLEKMAYHDALTGIPNRPSFLKSLAKIINVPYEQRQTVALFSIDLDKFKEVNDTLGHAAGDELLKKVSEKLLRKLDIDSSLFRMGGDEFVILSKSYANKSRAAYMADAINTLLANPIVLPQGEVLIGSSIGIALLPEHAHTIQEALRCADLALYHAKNNGRGCYAFYDVKLDEEMRYKANMAKALKYAIDKDQLDVHFQPQINANTREIFGLEALVRWNHPELGNIPPSVFVPIAETSGLIVELGNAVLRKSCAIARLWLDSGFDFKHVAVNISPLQLWQPDFEIMVAKVLKHNNLDAKYLCLEVTESVFVNSSENRVLKVLNALRDLNISLSLDDFGTGYSSLSYLNQLPFDQLKVDRSFVTDVHLDSKKARVLSGVIALGQGLGLKIVVEGVEKAEEAEFVSRHHCDAIQGYFYAKPMEAIKIPNEINRIRFDEKYRNLLKFPQPERLAS